MSGNILVVDDDKEIVQAIAINLEQEGFRVFKAYDGLEALEIAMSQDLQLIIIDVMMPKLDGLSAVLKIRERKNFPIMILSAKSEDADKVLGLMLSNGLVSFSGALLAQYQGFVDVGMGRGAIVIGLAAVIIGEVAFSKIFHNFALKLLAVVIGAILYYIVIQVVLWLGLNTNDLKMLQALVVAMFLAVPYWKNRYFKKKGDANHG